MIKPDEREELLRIMDGGDFSQGFWRSRWQDAREPSQEELLRAELQKLGMGNGRGSNLASPEIFRARRQARKIVAKLNKLNGIKRAFNQSGYGHQWSEEQRRLDNLEHAAIYLSRANTGFHFYS